jgi:hypothetical protein
MLVRVMRATTAEELEAVAGVAAGLGVGPVTPVVVSLAKHTIVRLAPLPLVARVHSRAGLSEARAGLAREVSVAGYLAARHAPVIRPAGSIDPGPYVRGRCAMTIWEFTPHRAVASDADAWLAARALRQFHEAFAPFGEALPLFTVGIGACGDLVATRSRTPGLGAEDRQFLSTLHARLREALSGYAYRSTPLHGDAHLGNALLTKAGAVWVDLEAVCSGPREWDIACLPVSTWPAFDGVNLDLTRCLADLRSLCVAVWCWADYGRSLQVNEAAEHHLRSLRTRFGYG